MFLPKLRRTTPDLARRGIRQSGKSALSHTRNRLFKHESGVILSLKQKIGGRGKWILADF
jgi:hypothetical protein